MDIWQMLRADHANIRELCREISGTWHGPDGSRDRLFHQFGKEVERHLGGKEAVLYPALKHHEPTRAHAAAMERSHDELRERVEELENADGGRISRNWMNRFEQLASRLEREFRHVEDDVLPALRAALRPEEEETLTRQFERERIAALMAERWHIPRALSPRRYGVSGTAVFATVALLAAVTAAIVWGSRSEARQPAPAHRPSRFRSRSAFSRRTDMQSHQIISTHPDVRGNTNDVLIRCIDECFSCAQTCVSCADACLAESMVQQLRQCIRLNLDCADVCAATGTIATRRTGSNEQVIRLMLQACQTACRLCAEECEKHANMHEHCRICAEACRRCETACEEALRSM